MKILSWVKNTERLILHLHEKFKMKKLVAKDNKIRYFSFNYIEKKRFVLKLIFKNFNFFNLIRWNALLKLELLTNNSKISAVNRCLLTVNKKRHNILSVFSRHIFIKLIRKGLILNFQKSS